MNRNTFKPGQRDLIELMAECDSGQIQLPNFQRGYNWKTNAVLKLLESIHKGHPAGSLLFLENRKPEALIGYERIRTVEEDKELLYPEFLVLDGQQRLTSCHAVFYNRGNRSYFINLRRLFNNYGNGDFESFELVDDKILVAKQHNTQPEEYLFSSDLLPLSSLKDQDTYTKLIATYRRNLPLESESEIKYHDFIEFQLPSFTRPFFQYSFPLVELSKELSIEAVCKVFQSINTTGLKLSAFDICVARFMPPPNPINLKTKIDKVIEENDLVQVILKNDQTLILQTIALLANVSPKKNNLPKNLESHHVIDEWETALDGLISIVEVFDVFGAGVSVSTKLIPYSPMLAVGAAVLGKKKYSEKSVPEKSEIMNKIRKWFFKSSIEMRYTEGTDNKMQKDYEMLKKWMDPSSDEPKEISIQTVLSKEKIKLANKNGAFGKAVLCMYNQSNPKDFYSNEEVGVRMGLKVKSQLHHVFPNEAFKNSPLVNSVFNFTFLTAQSNNFIKDKKPSEYYDGLLKETGKSEDQFNNILEHHLINKYGVKSMREDNIDRFVEIRIDEFKNYLLNEVNLKVKVDSDARGVEVESDDSFEPGLDSDDD